MKAKTNKKMYEWKEGRQEGKKEMYINKKERANKGRIPEKRSKRENVRKKA